MLSKLEAARAALAAAGAVAAAGETQAPDAAGSGGNGGEGGRSGMAAMTAEGVGSVARNDGAADVATARLRDLGALLKAVADYLEAAGD